MKNVIILQTVLDAIKSHSKNMYTRVRSLVENKARHFYVFSNEHHRDTYVEREKTETLQERDDRGKIQSRIEEKWRANFLISLQL